jgi:hypothetical protein
VGKLRRRLVVQPIVTPVTTPTLPDRARTAFGEWLGGLDLWDHFATLTFDYYPSLDTARRLFDVWVKRLERDAKGRVNWFWVLERGAFGKPHLHALVSGTAGIGSTGCVGAWSFGLAEAVDYDRNRAASYYLTKTLNLDWAEYDLSVKPR